MKKLLALLIGLLLAGTFSNQSLAQYPCHFPCKVGGGGDGPPVANEIYIQCSRDSCAPCGYGCTTFHFWNEYTCGKKINKIVFSDPSAATLTPYKICDAFLYTGIDSCEWVVNYGDQQDSTNTPCTLSSADQDPYNIQGEYWEVTPASNCAGAGQGQAVFIRYCGPSCHKCFWTVYFDDGNSCPVDMSSVNGGYSCCSGDGG